VYNEIQGNMNIALELYFDSVKPLTVYKKQKICDLPKGERPGFDNAVFILSPSKADADATLLDGFLSYKTPLYKNYMVDFMYNDKIGHKKYIKNNAGIFKKEFETIKFMGPMVQVMGANKKEKLSKLPNVLVNLGEWMNVYFQFAMKGTSEKVCDNFITFLSTRINDSVYNNYNKVLYIDLWQWFGKRNMLLGLSVDELNNPLSILLVALYKAPELFRKLGICTIMIADSKNKDLIKINTSDLIKDNYPIIKNRLLMMSGLAESVNQLTIDADSKTTPKSNEYKLASTINTAIISKNEKAKQQLLASLRKNLLGDDSEDITSDFTDDDDDEFPDIIETDSVKDADIEKIASDYLDENPELYDINADDALKEVEDVVKKRYYIAKFTPERTKDTMNRIQDLTEVQDNVIGLPSFTDLESKVLDEIDLSDFVNTGNANILKTKFATFDKCYNKKKLHKDIDESVGILSQAEFKVFVTDKIEEDTSDQLNQKKTVTYKLIDEDGRKMNIKLDLPIIVEDKYVYLNGSKKILQHQLILKPIVKTKPNTVQIVTCLNKVFMTRRGSEELHTTSLYKYMLKHPECEVIPGNGTVMNKNFLTTVEFDMIGKKIYEFTVGDNKFMTDIPGLLQVLKSKNVKFDNINLTKYLIIGYNMKEKTPIYIDKLHDSYADKVISFFSNEAKEQIIKGISKKRNKQLLYNQCKIMSKEIPVIAFLLYCEGLETVMKKANIEYKFVTEDEIDSIDPYFWGINELGNGYLVWKRYPIENSLLMNGLSLVQTELYDYDEFESKDTYIAIISQFFAHANMVFNLDQFKDFMIDNVTREILMDYHLPTDVVSVFLYANKLLADNDFKSETHLSNMRIRSNEVIAAYVYEAITNAYGPYRKTKYKRNPTYISLKGNEVMLKIKKGANGLSEEESVLNPILQLSKSSSVTYKGFRGIGLDDAMTLDKRAYNDSMLGILGITTSPDAGVGVNRNLTFEPAITSTRGYLDIIDRDNVDQLTAPNLLTAAEMLTPLGVQHDDPARTAMAYKQSMYMLLVNDSDPVMIGNGVEKVVPYRMSNEFTTIAKDDGKVIDIVEDLVVIKYKDGTYQTIDTGKKTKKNSASGFYIATKLTCNKKLGDAVKRGEVVAWNNDAFKKNTDDLSASMRLGTLVKIAIIPEWDIYEDSAPISTKASKKMTSTMIMDTEVTLKAKSHIYQMAQIGDYINTGDPLIKFDQGYDDEDTNAYFDSLRKTLNEKELAEFVDSNSTSKKSKYTGMITDIKVFCTVELDELSPSLREVTSKYYDKLDKREKVLNKYSNPGDTKYIKSGQLITESPTRIDSDYQGKARGAIIGEGILIIFYTEFEDRMAKGDKLAAEFALKSINSHVIDEGLEPYSEFNPDETIDLITAPLSISARKTPTIFIAMFGNKLIIEAKRHLKKYWEEN